MEVPGEQTSFTATTAGAEGVIEWWNDNDNNTTSEQQQPPLPQNPTPMAATMQDIPAAEAIHTDHVQQMERVPSLELKLETAVPNREELTRAKEQSREAAQLRTYTRWINSQLKDGTPPIQINDPVQDLRNGVVLINLLHRLYGIPLPHYHMQPSSKIHALDNIVMAFNMLEQVTSTTYPFLKPANVIDGDVKMMMGMIWTLVLDSGVRRPLAVGHGAAGQAAETPSPANMQALEQTANAALLSWCQERTRGYQGVNIQNFTDSFADGLAFNALLHSYDPSLVDYTCLNPAAKEENLHLAFATADQRLGIPQLLDVTDFNGQNPVDAHSIITYVSEYVKRFAVPPTSTIVHQEPVSFPQPTAPPLPPRQQTQPTMMGYDDPNNYAAAGAYGGYGQPVPPPPGYGLAPPMGYYAPPPQYYVAPPRQPQPPPPHGEGVNLYDYRKTKSSKGGRKLIEKTYLWGK